MLELKISNEDILSKAVKPLMEIAGEGIPNYSPDGISIIALDPEESVHVVLSIEAFDLGNNEFFLSNHSGVAVVDFVELRDRLELEQDEDCITIFAGAREDRFHILFGKVGLFNQFRHLEMELTPVTQEHLDSVRAFQQYDRYEAFLGIPSEDFYENFQDWVRNEAQVSLTITHEQVKFSAKDKSYVLPKGGSERGECIIEGVGVGDRVEAEITLLKIHKFMDASLLSSRVWIFLSEDIPTMLNFPVAAVVCVTVTYEQVRFSVGDQSSVLPKGESERAECIIEGVGDEDRVEIKTTLVTVNKFTDASLLSSRVWIYLSEGAPAILKFSVAEIGNIVFHFNE